MTMTPITIEYLAELTQRAWRFAENEWPELPREPLPAFELKTKADRKNQGIGYNLAEMKALDRAEVISRVIHEVSIFATLYRGADQEQVEETCEILVARINEANAAEAGQSTKH